MQTLITKICGVCKKKFRRPKSKVRANTKFCSVHCRAKAGGRASVIGKDRTKENNSNWKGGVSKNRMRYKRRDEKRHPKHVKAREMVHSRVRCGTIVKPKECEECGSTKYIESHHEDYAKPLNVKWLCRKCHKSRHKKKK